MGANRLKVVAAFILLCVLLIIGYDLFKTLKQNNALYRDLLLELSLRNDPTRKADGTTFIGETFIDFELPDLSNQLWRLGDLKSELKIIIIFSLDDCHLCLQEYPLWKKLMRYFKKNN